MLEKSTASYRFGDLLALARQSWVSQMARELGATGYSDYRRSDAAVIRMLQRGPISIGQLGEALGVTRQAARKVVNGLEWRGYAMTVRGDRDARQVNVFLTAEGEAYSAAVIAVIDHLNRALCQRVDPAALSAVDGVLRAVLADDHTRTLAARLAPPPAIAPAGVRR